MSYASEVLADSPAAYYRCQEASGLLQDSSGNARHTTATGGPGAAQYQDPSAIPSDPADFSVEISDFYWTSPDGAWFDFGDVFTVEMWFKRDGGVGNAQNLITKGVDSFQLLIDTTSEILFVRRGVAVICTSTIAVTDITTWHHLVCTKNGATSKIYIDGVDRTGVVTNSTMINNATALFIGAREDGNFALQANIDEIALYPGSALSQARVLAHYQAAPLQPTASVAWLGA